MAGLRLIIEGKKYNVDGGAEWLEHKSDTTTQDLTEAFLEWMAAHGGRVGKP